MQPRRPASSCAVIVEGGGRRKDPDEETRCTTTACRAVRKPLRLRPAVPKQKRRHKQCPPLPVLLDQSCVVRLPQGAPLNPRTFLLLISALTIQASRCEPEGRLGLTTPSEGAKTGLGRAEHPRPCRRGRGGRPPYHHHSQSITVMMERGFGACACFYSSPVAKVFCPVRRTEDSILHSSSE
jgi:hypothetical protein